MTLQHSFMEYYCVYVVAVHVPVLALGACLSFFAEMKLVCS